MASVSTILCDHVLQHETYRLLAQDSVCKDNNGIQKGVYYKLYWKVLNNVGLWNNPRYLAVKVQRANWGECAISHKREVMPICVLVQLRALYANPYMDHMWN